MKVLMLSTDMRIFEAGSAVAARLSKYGALGDVTFLVFGIGKPKDIQLGAGVRAVAAGGGGKVGAFFAGAGKLFSLTRNKRADIVSSQDPFFVGLLALVCAKMRGIPFQAQLHTDCFSNSYAEESARRLFETIMASFVVGGASCVRAVSERVAKTARRITGKPVSTLPVLVSPVAPVQKNTGEEFNLLTVARLTPEKRIDILLRALRDIPDTRLTIVGNGPLRSEFEALARTLGVESRVEFAGWQNPQEYYARAHVFLQASRYEGYGMALMEAALNGVPAVTTDVGVVGEIFRTGEDLLIAEPTAPGFAAEIVRLKSDRALRERLGASARKKAEASLVTEDEYLARYRQALLTCF